MPKGPNCWMHSIVFLFFCIGNFVADIMLSATNVDVVILNSGTLRSDCIHPKGEFKIKDLMTILPTVDQLSVLKINGKEVRYFWTAHLFASDCFVCCCRHRLILIMLYHAWCSTVFLFIYLFTTRLVILILTDLLIIIVPSLFSVKKLNCYRIKLLYNHRNWSRAQTTAAEVNCSVFKLNCCERFESNCGWDLSI